VKKLRTVLLTALLASACCLLLLACGSSSKKTRQSTEAKQQTPQQAVASEQAELLKESISQLSPPAKIAPSTILAHVASTPITFAQVEHRMHLQSPEAPLPDPPAYSSCIARERAKAGGAQKSEGELKESCRTSYEHLLQLALSTAIHNLWLVGEAAEEGIHVSAREVQEEFQASKAQFRSEAQFNAYRKSTGQTLADMKEEVRIGKYSDAIFKNIKAREHPITDAEVLAYYNAHKSQYTIPEGRDVKILRTTTEASALRAKQELRQGKSFASIAKGLSSVAQPITAKDGEVKDLIPHLFEEKTLNNAIFNAKLNQLYGPLRVASVRRTIAPESNSGFFLFEVIKTIPARPVPLGQVRNGIAEELAKTQKERNLETSIAKIKAKWRARTICQAGFIVDNCSQYKAREAEAHKDPFTL
jgi:PPIC-type PPIASE domain